MNPPNGRDRRTECEIQGVGVLVDKLTIDPWKIKIDLASQARKHLVRRNLSQPRCHTTLIPSRSHVHVHKHVLL